MKSALPLVLLCASFLSCTESVVIRSLAQELVRGELFTSTTFRLAEASPDAVPPISMSYPVIRPDTEEILGTLELEVQGNTLTSSLRLNLATVINLGEDFDSSPIFLGDFADITLKELIFPKSSFLLPGVQFKAIRLPLDGLDGAFVLVCLGRKQYRDGESTKITVGHSLPLSVFPKGDHFPPSPPVRFYQHSPDYFYRDYPTYFYTAIYPSRYSGSDFLFLRDVGRTISPPHIGGEWRLLPRVPMRAD